MFETQVKDILFCKSLSSRSNQLPVVGMETSESASVRNHNVEWEVLARLRAQKV